MSLSIVRDLVFPALKKHGHRRAVIANGRTWSYREIEAAALEVADVLAKRAVSPGDPVAILIENSAEYLIADLAIIAVGAAKVPINLMLSDADVKYILQDSGSAVVLTSSHTASRFDGLDLREDVPGSITINVDGTHFDVASEGYERAPALSNGKAKADDLALIMYTGGTTGRPKGVVHLQQGVINNLLAHVIESEITASDHLLLSSPLPHSAGVLALTGLLQGAVVEVMTSFDLDATINKIESEGVTYLFMVPTMIGRLLDAAQARPTFESDSLRTILYGASPISEERLRQGLDMFGPVFMQLYGQTEAPNFLTRLRRDDHDVDGAPQRLRSCGQAALMAKVRIIAEDGNACKPGEVGEVIATAPYVMDRYWNRPDTTSETLRDGWLYTGDLGYVDEDGYLFLVDRKKEMIITGGLNVYASEVEQALAGLEGVREVAVVGAPDDDWGEIVTAYVVPSSPDVTAESLSTAARDVLTGYKRPKVIRLTDTLPTTAVGKINKKALRSELENS